MLQRRGRLYFWFVTLSCEANITARKLPVALLAEFTPRPEGCSRTVLVWGRQFQLDGRDREGGRRRPPRIAILPPLPLRARGRRSPRGSACPFLRECKDFQRWGEQFDRSANPETDLHVQGRDDGSSPVTHV